MTPERRFFRPVVVGRVGGSLGLNNFGKPYGRIFAHHVSHQAMDNQIHDSLRERIPWTIVS